MFNLNAFNLYTFKPVGPFIASIPKDRIITLFERGPAALAIVSTVDQSEIYVLANFMPVNPICDWVDEHNHTTGYALASFADTSMLDNPTHGITMAQDMTWTMWLNLTHTHLDLVVRRHVRRATSTAKVKSKLFSDIPEDFYDWGNHPTTMAPEDVWDYTFTKLNETSCREDVSVDVKVWAQLKIDDLMGPSVDDDCEPRETYASYPPLVDGDFPDWDDPEHGLERRMSREYQSQFA